MLARGPLTRLASFTFACAVTACARPRIDTSAAPAPGTAVARAQIDSAMNRYNRFMRAGPADSLAALFTPDGELFDAENALTGRKAIRAFFEPLTRSVRIQSAASTTHALDVIGATALQWGDYVQNAGPVDQTPRHYRGRFVAEWKRGSNGRWLLRRIMLEPLNGG
jgi:ketosteroid isomerase-like protein